MAESNKNNVANVSSARGVKGGYIFTAPAGTALPNDYKTALPAAWKCRRVAFGKKGAVRRRGGPALRLLVAGRLSGSSLWGVPDGLPDTSFM